jgi:hypothetical protein
VLAGRHTDPIEMLAEDLRLPARVFDLGDARAAAAALAARPPCWPSRERKFLDYALPPIR